IDEAVANAKKLGGDVNVVKAQIHAGGRGKAGGVKVAKNIDEVHTYAKEILGKTLVTHQTGPEGKEVKRLLIEEGCNIDQEYYLGLVLDRNISRIVLMGSEEGGMEIEEVAAESPEKIFKEVIDPAVGLTGFQARRMAFNLNFPKELVGKVAKLLINLYKTFIDKDCMTVEINQLVTTKEGDVMALDAKMNFKEKEIFHQQDNLELKPLVTTKESDVMAIDAKMNFDENALFRQQDIFELRDLEEEEANEIEASKYDLSYIQLDGNIGCMVNGAGLAMAKMDIIKYEGGNPANFLDVGGDATAEKVAEAFKIILSDPEVKGILVNVFGGIMKCDAIAEGIVTATKQLGLEIPLVVRLEGTNVELGKKI